ncbi:MAG: DUF4124 domain-containing protein [Bdellovibrionales bacterium]|nr:DUF4124 domain-containing protein [Bdellovibrionales bacterium]
MRPCFALFLALVLPLTAGAEVFKYTTEQGQVHFVDSLEKVPEAYRSQAGGSPLPPISKVSPGRENLYEKEHYPAPPSPTKASVEIFVTEWCPYCQKLEEFLTRERIAFKKLDVEKDPKAGELHQSLGGGVPLTRIGETVISGFDENAIRAALRKR